MVTAVVEDGQGVAGEAGASGRPGHGGGGARLSPEDRRCPGRLPGEIPHRDGVYNLSRAALMAVSLASGRYENLAVACGDRLHQPYRLKLIPHGEEVLAICRELGLTEHI